MAHQSEKQPPVEVNGVAAVTEKAEVTQKDAEACEDETEYKCGYFGCTPDWLQRLNNPRALLACACCMAFTQGGDTLLNINEYCP